MAMPVCNAKMFIFFPFCCPKMKTLKTFAEKILRKILRVYVCVGENNALDFRSFIPHVFI